MIEYLPFVEKIGKWLYGLFTNANLEISEFKIEPQREIKVIRAYIKNTGKIKAKDVEANLIALQLNGEPIEGFIRTPLWWMHNQFKQGDQRKIDIPSYTEKPLDIVNIVNQPQQNLLILSCRVFIGDYPFVFLQKGETRLKIELTSEERKLGVFTIGIDWDGTQREPHVKKIE